MSKPDNDAPDTLPTLLRLSYAFACLIFLIAIAASTPVFLDGLHDSILLLQGEDDDYYTGIGQIGMAAMLAPLYIAGFLGAMVGLFWFLFAPMIELPDSSLLANYRRRAKKPFYACVSLLIAIYIAGLLALIYGFIGDAVVEEDLWFALLLIFLWIILWIRPLLPLLLDRLKKRPRP